MGETAQLPCWLPTGATQAGKSTLALKSRADITGHPIQEYQWPHKKLKSVLLHLNFGHSLLIFYCFLVSFGTTSSHSFSKTFYLNAVTGMLLACLFYIIMFFAVFIIAIQSCMYLKDVRKQGCLQYFGGHQSFL